MMKEDKQLLLKDLCARLPYGVICTDLRHGDSRITNIDTEDNLIYCFDFDEYVKVENCRLYLRPMSSMTEEEKKELKEISDEYLDQWMSANDPSVRWKLDANNSSKRAEFYNSHYLDWNGLIEKGLALEAQEGMYKTE